MAAKWKKAIIPGFSTLVTVLATMGTALASGMDMPGMSDMPGMEGAKTATGHAATSHATASGSVWLMIFVLVALGLSAFGFFSWRHRRAAGKVPGEEGNLLKIPLIGKVIKSKWYPGILQVPTALVFAFIIYELFFGPAEAHDNFGTALTWVLWWPLIPLLFLLLGRFWCAICPFATLSDLVQKLFGRKKPVPAFLRKYGIWIIDGIFILITWADHTLGIVENPRGSGTLLMLIVLGVVTIGALFERRTWCRYLCFLGGLSGNYSRAGALELRATPSKCAACKVQACYKGGEKAPGCPMFEFPRTMDTSARCNLCGYCVKNCPNDSLTMNVRVPSSELWGIRKPKFDEAFLATVIMGIVFVQNITMLKVWKHILAVLEGFFGTTNYYVTFTAVFAVLMALPAVMLYVASALSRRSGKRTVSEAFTLFGYSLIPLDLAGHLAHNLFHLLAEGKSIIFTAMGLFGIEMHGSTGIIPDSTIQILQYGLVILGTVASIYTAYRMSRGRVGEDGKPGYSAVPVAVFMVVLGIINLFLFYLPMEMRM